jgi:hypothetical protein
VEGSQHRARCLQCKADQGNEGEIRVRQGVGGGGDHLKEALQELVGIVYALRVLTDYPHHRCARLWLVQRVQAVAQCGDDVFIPASQTLI